MRRLFCFLFAVIFLLTACQPAEPVAPGYLDFLEKGLTLSEEQCQKRYQFDESAMKVEESSGYIIWYPAETYAIAGYDCNLRLDFEDGELIQTTYQLYLSGEGETLARDGYEAMLAVYHELEDALGETGSKDPNHISDSFPETLDHYGSFEEYYEIVTQDDTYPENIYWYLDDEYREGYHVEMQTLGAWALGGYQITIRVVSEWAS